MDKSLNLSCPEKILRQVCSHGSVAHYLLHPETAATDLGNISLQSEKAYFYLSNLSARIQKLLDLNKLLIENNNVDLAIDAMKPKIFWKDKPVFKKQLKIWDLEKLEKTIIPLEEKVLII